MTQLLCLVVVFSGLVVFSEELGAHYILGIVGGFLGSLIFFFACTVSSSSRVCNPPSVGGLVDVDLR